MFSVHFTTINMVYTLHDYAYLHAYQFAVMIEPHTHNNQVHTYLTQQETIGILICNYKIITWDFSLIAVC